MEEFRKHSTYIDKSNASVNKLPLASTTQYEFQRTIKLTSKSGREGQTHYGHWQDNKRKAGLILGKPRGSADKGNKLLKKGGSILDTTVLDTNDQLK